MNTFLQKMIRDDCRRVLGDDVGNLGSLEGSVLLVTGGTGFMGTWLAEMVAFLNDHHGFRIRLRLLATRASRFAKKAPHLASRPDIALIEQNTANIVELPGDVNWIIHAAGDPDGRNHATNPLGTIRSIVDGTDALLQAASRLGNLRRILHVSSGLIYGPQPADLARLPENHVGAVDCTVPGQAYSESKRLAETICAAYRTQVRLPIVTVRPFAFLGPYQPLELPWAATNFIRDSLLGGPIRIQGDGQSVRSYMYPADLAWWLLTALAKGSAGAVYNVGSSQGISLMDLATKIVSLLPDPVKIVTRTSGSNVGITRLVPDTTAAESTLGLSLKTDLDTAVRSTLHWYRNLQQSTSA